MVSTSLGLELLHQRVRKETTEAGATQEEGSETPTEAGPACQVGDTHERVLGEGARGMSLMG